jgi:hypothetical protein
VNSDQLASALVKAAAHLREKGDYHFLNDEPDVFTTFELATLIEKLAERREDGLALQRLWGIFAPTCAWDDAGGDSHIGEEAFQMITTACAAHRES